MRTILLSILCCLTLNTLSAQEMPERGELRRGNSEFNDGNYDKAAQRYERAIELAPRSFAAGYNLGNAHLKAQDLPKAQGQLKVMATDSLQGADDRADAYYNLGNAYFQEQKLKEALDSYKSSLRLRPDDMECKYNYAYTKKLLDNQQQNEDQQDQQDQQQNQDQQQENQDQNQDQQDQQDQQQNQDQQDQQQDQQQNQDQQNQDQQNQQPQDGQISQQEQDQILDAIQAQEDKTQDKLDEMRQGVIIPGRKSW